MVPIPYCIDHLKMQPAWIIFLSSLAVFSIFKKFMLVLQWVFRTFLRPEKDLKIYGSWALVTGSTDGIGLAFAFKLAEKGLNLVLVSRDPNRLKQISGEIQEKYPEIEVKVLEIEFSSDLAVSRVNGALKEMIQGLDIGVLINNVGITYPGAMYFHEVGENIWMNLVKVNVLGTTHVTKAVIRGMIRRGRGAVVNIGSGAAIVVPSHPLYAIYAASKAYVDQFSRSLYMEYKHRGIDVQCQVPLYVSTKMAASVAFVEKPSVFIPTAQHYVEAAIRRIGHESRCTPYWAHSIQWFFASILPDFLLDTWRLSIGRRRLL